MKNENEKTLLLFDKLTNSLNQTDYQVAFNKLENLRGNTYNGRAHRLKSNVLKVLKGVINQDD